MEKDDDMASPDGMPDEPRTNSRVFTYLIVIAEVSALAVVIMVTVWMGHFRGGFAWHDDVVLQFNYHPLFMTIGLVLHGNAMLMFRVFRSERKIRLKIAHSLMQLLAFIMLVVGLKAVFDSHNLRAVPHTNMFSLHSWIGIATVILFGIQWLVGFVSFLLPCCRQPMRAIILPIHTFFGVVIFCLIVATMMTGITEKLNHALRDKYSAFVSEGVMVNTAGVLLLTMAVTVVFIVTNPNYKRQPLPEEEIIPLTAI